jgi:asparagine synthase (glutamine-hydrolysing)
MTPEALAKFGHGADRRNGMSALCGIVRFDGIPVGARDLERMLGAMALRAPDRRKFWCDGAVGLGHGLLRVTREDAFDAQPLHDDDAGLTLVADVRLDNREELANVLHVDEAGLSVTPDSALLLLAYKEWGENCAEHLLGDFFFAVWDANARKLVLMRDHMGQRGVSLFRNREFCAFASDLKALRSLRDVPRTLSEHRIARMLLSDTTRLARADGTDHVETFPGATVAAIGIDGSFSERTYWKPGADPTHIGRDEAYYVQTYRQVLGEAVACRIRRTMAPPGLLFSGGFDSAAVAALAGPVLAPSGRKLVAASSVMPAEYRGPLRHARQWTEYCRRDMAHLDVRYVTRESIDALTDLEKNFIERDVPAHNSQYVDDALRRVLAGAGVRAVLDGHGGDYTLNPRGHGALARFLATGQLRRFLSEFAAHLRHSGHGLRSTIAVDVVGMLLPRRLRQWWQRAKHGFAPPWHATPIVRPFAEKAIAEGAVDPDSRRDLAIADIHMRADLQSRLDRISHDAGHFGNCVAGRDGLEITHPFHDKRVVELALAIPEDLYVKNGFNRYLARVALKGIYPPEYQSRGRRNDFSTPDFPQMVKAIAPRLLADIARMEKSDYLSRHIDFAKLRRHIAACRADHRSDAGRTAQLVVRTFLTARYIEWFRGDNR